MGGNSCIFKEVVQVNYDKTDEEELLKIGISSQKVLDNVKLARLELTLPMVLNLLEQCKSRTLGGGELEFSEEMFVRERLLPRGTLWFHIRPFQEDGSGARTCDRLR